MGKRLKKLKLFLTGMKTREQVKKLVNQDWQKAEQNSALRKQEFSSKFEFTFTEENVNPFRLPVQFEESNTNQNEFKFDIPPRKAEFDDFVELEQLKLNDLESQMYSQIGTWKGTNIYYWVPLEPYKYEKDTSKDAKDKNKDADLLNQLQMPPTIQIAVHASIEEARVLRQGAEEEYTVRGRTGPFETLDQAKEVLEGLPQTFFYKIDQQSH